MVSLRLVSATAVLLLALTTATPISSPEPLGR
jgi:hypothetical protein